MDRRIFLIQLLFISISCTEQEKSEIPVIELKPYKTITQLDSLFFTNISIFSDSERNYIVSQNPVFLAATDKEFNLLWTNLSEGQGPNELYFPEQGKVLMDHVYILDQGNQSIKKFDSKNGEFVSSTKISENFMKFRFDISESENYYVTHYSPIDEFSVIKLNNQGKILKKFGTVFPERAGPNRQMKYFQLDGHENIILIGASLPYIEILNQEGESIKRFDIEVYEPIKRALDSLENDIIKGVRINENSIPMMIKDVQYVNGRLYVSFTDRIGENRTNARNLLVFKLNENECELEMIYKFNTSTDDDNLHPAYFYIDQQAQKLYVQGLITKHIYIFDLSN